MAPVTKEDLFSRIIKYGLFAVIILTPLVRYPYILETVSLPKFAFIVTSTTLLLGAWLAGLILKGELSLKSSPLYFTVFGFWAISVLATMTSLRPTTSWFGNITRYQGLLSLTCYLILFLLAVNHFKSDKDRLHCMIAVAVAGSAAAIIGVLQHFGFGFGSLHLFFVGSKTRVESNLGNPNFLGAFLTLTIPVSFAALFIFLLNREREESGRMSPFVFTIASLVVSVVLQFSALYFTLSRGAWIGVASAFLAGTLLVFFATTAVKKKILVPTVIFLVLLTISLSASAFFVFYRHQLLFSKKPKHQVAAVFSYVTGSATSKSRFMLWSATLGMIKDHPILGTGPDTYGLAFPKYRPPTYDKRVGFSEYPDRPHNDFLQTATEVGLPGFSFYLATIIAAIGILLRILRRSLDPSRSLFAVFTIASIVGYTVQNQFNFHTISTAPLYWLIIGVIASIGNEKEKIVLSIPGWQNLARSAKILILLFLSSALILVPLRFCYPLLVASRHAYRATRFEMRNLFDDAIAEAKRARDLVPSYEHYSLFIGKIYDTASISGGETKFYYHDQAIANFEQAIEVNPLARKAYLELGVSHLEFAEREKDLESATRAAQVFKEATELEPNYSQAHYNLGVSYYYLGELDSAIEEFKKTAKLNPKEADAYFLLGRSYEKLGTKKEAIRSYKKVVEIDPDYGRKERVKEALKRLGE